MDKLILTFHPEGAAPVVLTCEVAKSYSEKTKGLMGRASLPEGNGMLFLFWFSWYRLFWMKGVLVPLDIIFINKESRVVSIHEAPANFGIFNKKFWAGSFCKCVVECNMGFCKSHHISVGTKVIYT